MTTDDELDLVETARLLKALERRFDCYVFGAVTSLGSENEVRHISWNGGFVSSMGLISFIDRRFNAMVLKTEPEDVDD